MAGAVLGSAFLDSRPAPALGNPDLFDYSTDLVRFLYGKRYLDVVKLPPERCAHRYKRVETPRIFIKHFSADLELFEKRRPSLALTRKPAIPYSS